MYAAGQWSKCADVLKEQYFGVWILELTRRIETGVELKQELNKFSKLHYNIL